MIVTILCLAFVIASVAMRVFGGRPGSVTLLEYQRGILYRRGHPVREVGTGRHLIFTGIERLMVVDTRPIQVSYEDQAVALRDGSAALYSVSGAARVQDAKKAIYSAANYNHVPAFVLLCSARLVLNSSTSSEIRAQDALAAQIVERAKPRLAAAGFELLSFRLTQMAVTQRTFD
ncbi:MAG TPA: SPFH domain-containing protein [Candidatus Aquilonibacter sp.]|nr:SPFH domain-containing protein [Candidatus Aquilonibacter sp.]